MTKKNFTGGGRKTTSPHDIYLESPLLTGPEDAETPDHGTIRVIPKEAEGQSKEFLLQSEIGGTARNSHQVLAEVYARMAVAYIPKDVIQSGEIKGNAPK
jgi:hypothetical protein